MENAKELFEVATRVDPSSQNAASVDRTQCLQMSNRSLFQSGALPSELKPLGFYFAFPNTLHDPQTCMPFEKGAGRSDEPGELGAMDEDRGMWAMAG